LGQSTGGLWAATGRGAAAASREFALKIGAAAGGIHKCASYSSEQKEGTQW